MPPTNEQVEAQLARLLASNTLGRSERLCRFLQFVVRHTLEGRGDELKEYAIGVEVFEKGADFDPRLDSAVRVDARRLRAKLDEYYATEGNRDPVVIRMPKGGYLPIFLDREDATVREPLTLTGEVPIAPVTGTPAHPVPATEGPSRPKWVVWGAALAVFAALIAGVLVWRSRESTEVQPGRGYVARAVAVLPFANLTGNQQNDALCDGLAEELTRRLS
ncbi:MAG TPA: hypothetical protein VE621_19555, partial [Bryobacteraceae bacterium]|nr:hypothetical protein [Bryobacteraceae bacterium]